LIIFA